MMQRRSEPSRLGGALAALALLPLLLALCAAAPPAGAAEPWMAVPAGWEDRRAALGRDLVRQLVAPGGVAVIEAYSAKAPGLTLVGLADGMEQGMRQRGASYLDNRLAESRRPTADGHDALFREYAGLYNGIPLRAVAVYTLVAGEAVAAFGFWAEREGAAYRDTVVAAIRDLRFGAPPPGGGLAGPGGGTGGGLIGALPGAGGGTAGGYPAGDCRALFARPGTFDFEYVRTSDGHRTRLALVVTSAVPEGEAVRVHGTWHQWVLDGVATATGFTARSVEPVGNAIELTATCSPAGAGGRMQYTRHAGGAPLYAYTLTIRPGAPGPGGTPVSPWPPAGGGGGTVARPGGDGETDTTSQPKPPTGETAMEKACYRILGAWRTTDNKRTFRFTRTAKPGELPHGLINDQPTQTWACRTRDGSKFAFRWERGKAIEVWDDVRMSADGRRLTRYQAGAVWDRLVKVD